MSEIHQAAAHRRRIAPDITPAPGNPVRALLLIDHGSRRTEANEMLECMAALVQRMAGAAVVVRHAHMELAEPSIPRGVEACIAAGATEIIAFPYMLSPGRHSTTDIPAMVAAAAQAHPAVRVRVTPAFGIESELGEVILRRAGIDVAAHVETSSDCGCWQPDGHTGRCGDACPANGSAGRVDAAVGAASVAAAGRGAGR
jgi:sirohydrochlorin ferrochelatase